MKATHKLLLLATALLTGTLFLASCGDKQSSSGNTGSSSKSASDETIPFHNTLIGFTKLAREPLPKIISATKDSASWVSRDGVITEKPKWNLVLIGINPFEKLAKTNLSAPKSFSSDDQTFFNSRIKTIKDSAAELNQIIATLKTYYQAEDYKDDKHQKFLALEPRIKDLVSQISTACGEMGDQSEKLAAAAERKHLEKDPIGIYILTMRDLMEKCGGQLDTLTDDRLLQVGSGTSFTDESKAEAAAKVKDLIDAAEKLSSEIAAMADKAKNIDRSALQKRPALARNYDNFLKALENEQAIVRKNIRFAKEWGYIGTASSMKNLAAEYRPLVSAHNSFIDSLNKGQ